MSESVRVCVPQAAQRELERQRKEELERRRRGELERQKSQEQEDVSKLKARKRSLEMELEAVGNKHRQISERLRDAQSKRKVQCSELDLANQRRDTVRQDINSLQQQLEVCLLLCLLLCLSLCLSVSRSVCLSPALSVTLSVCRSVCHCRSVYLAPPNDASTAPVLQENQRKLSQLTPEQQRLSDKLRDMALNNLPGTD
uniref:Uncharacterized protein n=1 Tax=Hucho hucho TaxID=62062 RepID=A0A4W5K9A8_9TELE